MKLEIVRINVNDIHTGKSICTSWQTKENIIVVDGENNCIFGEGYLSILEGEIDVLKATDCDPDEICLSMHSSGRFCKTDFNKMLDMNESKLSQFGYPNLSFVRCNEIVDRVNNNSDQELF